jgi:hypothetical protein
VIEVLVDGKPVALSPRRAEMVRQLIEEADPAIDSMPVGGVEFRLAQAKVTMLVTSSKRPVKVPDWCV